MIDTCIEHRCPQAAELRLAILADSAPVQVHPSARSARSGRLPAGRWFAVRTGVDMPAAYRRQPDRIDAISKAALVPEHSDKESLPECH